MSTNEASGGVLAAGADFGQYRIVRLLGRGGMGAVYEAEHRVLGRRYALKLVPESVSSQPGALQRFEREARVMANLSHANILAVDEFGETAGRYWLRLELAGGLEGDASLRSLADLVARHGGRLPQDEFLPILRQILSGMAYAHEHGVVHRDLKPSNILFCGDTAKVSDFGLVRLVGEEWLRSQTELSVSRSRSLGGMATINEAEAAGTSTRSLLGTYEYMSPEQKRGEEATAASDVYVIGLMIYRLLTGEHDVGFSLPSQIDDTISPAWDDLIRACLAPSPEQRPKDCGAVLDLASGLLSGTAPSPKPRVAPACPPTGPAKRDASAVPSTGPVDGEDWTVPDLGMEFVWIKALNCWLGKYPVTNAEYRDFLSDHSSGEAGIVVSEGFLGIGRKTATETLDGDHQPVVSVNFEDACAYAAWMTERERAAGRLPDGLRYRLPTEEEFMAYAQCGDGRTYPWGSNWPPQYGNYGEIEGYNDGFVVSCPVEESGRNDWGLYGVGGNVWEVCADNTAMKQSFGAWCGASWLYNYRNYLRCVYRISSGGSGRTYIGGFRLVLCSR